MLNIAKNDYSYFNINMNKPHCKICGCIILPSQFLRLTCNQCENNKKKCVDCNIEFFHNLDKHCARCKNRIERNLKLHSVEIKNENPTSNIDNMSISELQSKLSYFNTVGMQVDYFEEGSLELDLLNKIQDLKFLIGLLRECECLNRHPSIASYKNPLHNLLDENISYLNKSLYNKMKDISDAKLKEQLMKNEAESLVIQRKRMEVLRQNLESEQKDLETKKKKLEEYGKTNKSFLESVVSVIF